MPVTYKKKTWCAFTKSEKLPRPADPNSVFLQLYRVWTMKSSSILLKHTHTHTRDVIVIFFLCRPSPPSATAVTALSHVALSLDFRLPTMFLSFWPPRLRFSKKNRVRGCCGSFQGVDFCTCGGGGVLWMDVFRQQRVFDFFVGVPISPPFSQGLDPIGNEGGTDVKHNNMTTS